MSQTQPHLPLTTKELAAAVYEWRVESFDNDLPQHGWRAGNTYPTEQDALDSANRDMRDAQLNGDEEGTSIFRLVPVIRIERPPIAVEYIKPTTYQAGIRIVQGRATVCVDLVKPTIDDDAPYARAEVALAETPIQIGTHRCSNHCEDLIPHADETLETAGWHTSIGWRYMDNGDWYNFATKI